LTLRELRILEVCAECMHILVRSVISN